MKTKLPYVSRGGLKLAAALDSFAIDVADKTCADLGCHVGGFTDCLLQHGAQKVFAVDTSYGTLAWKLRQDKRVGVLERTNALYFDPSTLDGFVSCDVVTIDMGWTRQHHAIDAALRWLRCDGDSRIITLIKPQYETEPSRLKKGVLEDESAADIATDTLDTVEQFGLTVLASMQSPIRGGGNKSHLGNLEYLALLQLKTG